MPPAGPSPQSFVHNRPVADRRREFKYRCAQALIFGLPVLVLQYFGHSLGGSRQEASRWIAILLVSLVAAGAGVVVVPCNTAHLWFDELERALALPMLHLVDAAIAEALARVPDGGKVGLLATDATLAELQRALPTTAALSTLWRAIDRLGITVKKNGSRRRTTPA